MIAIEDSDAGYLRFAVQTVDVFLAANGRLPSMDFVMAHLRNTSTLHGHRHALPGSGGYGAVATDLRSRFPDLPPGEGRQ